MLLLLTWTTKGRVHLAFLASPKTSPSFQHVRLYSTKQKGSTFSINGELSLPEPEQGFDSWQTKALQYAWGWITVLHSSIAVTSFATLQITDIQASLLWLSDFVDTQGHRKWMPVKVQNQAIYELSIHFKHFHVDATNTLIKMSLLHKSSNCNASTSSGNLTLSWRSSVHQKQLVSKCNTSFCLLRPLAIWNNEQCSLSEVCWPSFDVASVAWGKH